MGTLLQDLRFALRTLRRTPVFPLDRDRDRHPCHWHRRDDLLWPE
jgi:hypothetical protein